MREHTPARYYVIIIFARGESLERPTIARRTGHDTFAQAVAYSQTIHPEFEPFIVQTLNHGEMNHGN